MVMIKNHPIIFFLIIILYIAMTPQVGIASIEKNNPAIDMMIAIDNSCSMFPVDKLIPGCVSWGSDINDLRIKGTDLFFARLGFGEANEADYQVGVISFGDNPVLLRPLGPLRDFRDTLASKIANPKAQSATLLLPALKMAYQELRESPKRNPKNLPAVMLITDGVPWPREGQTNKDIENLLNENPDIQIFIMLLRNPFEHGRDFQQYVEFWKQLQTNYPFVNVYLIDQDSQIEATYNTIVSQLQSTTIGLTSTVSSQNQMDFMVSEYINKVIITIINSSSESKAKIVIQDSKGDQIQDNEPGVMHFRGEVNPIEVYAIEKARLKENLLENYWTIKSNKEVNVFVDFQGNYRFDILYPESDTSGVADSYFLKGKFSPKQAFKLRFNLLQENGDPVLRSQGISSSIILPNGQQITLSKVQQNFNEATGEYELTFNFSDIYPEIANNSGNFILLLNTNSTVGQTASQISIARVRIAIDVGPSPYIQFFMPKQIECIPNQSLPLDITLGDYQYAKPGSIVSSASYENVEVDFNAPTNGVISGDLSPLCESIYKTISCSGQSITNIQLKIYTELIDNKYPQVLYEKIPVRAIAPKCTAAIVLPSLSTVYPTPVIKLIDTDKDGLEDSHDQCPQTSGWSVFKGCPPGSWVWLVILFIFMVMVFGAVILSLPRLQVFWMAKPPAVYVAVTRLGKVVVDVTNVKDVGIKYKTNEVKIGGDPNRAHIFVSGLMPVEFVIVERENKVYLNDVRTGMARATFRALVSQTISTSHQEIAVWICINPIVLKNEIQQAQNQTPNNPIA